MDADQGKLFIGGISWETTEDKLKEYFQAFGEVIEVAIMKDRATGRARGFGFVIFADPSVVDKVVLNKHNIDGRMVEAKKAVPREEQQSVNRNNSGNSGAFSPSSIARTKKIFVGGLASSVTESDFRKYFEQFGAITDVVVMYDHHTQRPRGFGFITFESEDAVDRVLVKTFHQLNEKMVEVKRAIPKDLSPSPNRHIGVGMGASPHRGSPYYGQGFNSSPGSPYTFKMDNIIGSPLGSRSSYSPFHASLSYTNNANSGGLTNAAYNTSPYGGATLYSGAGYGGGSSGAYGRIGAGFSNSTTDTAYANLSGRSVWDNSLTSFGKQNSLAGFNNNTGAPRSNNYSGIGTWGLSQSYNTQGDNSLSYGTSRYGYGAGENTLLSSLSPNYGGQTSVYGSGGGGFGLSRAGSSVINNSYFGDLYGTPGYGDSTWRATPADTLKDIQTGSEIGNRLYDLHNTNGSTENRGKKSYTVSEAQSYED
ncbi:hypothetical protein KP509_23G034800 [Ceratopteris richardii]|uniref:RRM domain-containing protein n=1 Tax=Ceratopteris richardii TaxID=49495 RepID=A0A8T2RZ94_CERRI|nr:hypothetical protein KP509_23G034800 [Ceratopteris richardii]KAH7301623.1 hypothetical protein KP509_23G034800 [Ceratopteris richardii]KAH7301624.1 hypothetical protein KP509_23G034800 [Ceratopteris richardii]KAH7301625.1 hypothetical protein KP509_23G034800 [Ceratopteris richardii]KAH7301629.1 hypothetical protein KP509_23G034800 [Ceratopteris richardii]